MSVSPEIDTNSGNRFADALVDYLRRVDEGEAIDQVEFLADFPKVAERLWDYFEAADEVEERMDGEAVRAGVLPREFPYRFGDYLLTEEIGRGGRGVVYKARQISLDRVVAVKVIRIGRLADAVDEARFEDDALLPARLNHPNIVAVHEIGRHDGLAFFSMEYVEGESLAGLAGDGPMEPNRAARYVLTAAEAIECCHRQGTLHRDLKPSNVMIDGRDRVRIIDFGFAKRVEDDADHTATGELVGTVRYMSPEQARGLKNQIGPASDVYSLGAILYELLVGWPPFSGESMLDTLRMVVEREPAPLRSGDKQVPRDLETICLKCLAKEPAGRYTSAQQLADDLRRFLRHEPVRARRPGFIGRAWRWRKRQPGWAAAAAATVLAVTASIFGMAAFLIVSREAAVTRATAARERVSLLRIQQVRTSRHRDGWSEDAWKLAEGAVALRDGPSSDPELQAQVASTLFGLDVRLAERFENLGALHLALDERRGRLLIGGAHDENRLPGDARLWDFDTRRLSKLGLSDAGPVGFRADGTPWQLVASDAGLRMVDLITESTICRLTVPDELSLSDPLALAVLSDGSLISALASRDGRTVRLVWNGDTGEMLQELSAPAIEQDDMFTNRAAFSADGTLLAEGDNGGQIHVWSVDSGKRLALLHNGRTKVHCVCFARDTHNSGDTVLATELSGWLLAAGDSGGSVTVWDLGQGVRRTQFLGSEFDVYALAFSPDNSILASAGRAAAKLWDAATGRHLLNLGHSDFATDVVWSSDGNRLFVASRSGFVPGEVVTWNLEYGRGVCTFRGLFGRISKVRFSPDSKQIVALSHGWQVAVWDVEEGRLRFCLNVDQGQTADNAGLVFSREGRQLAYAAGAGASLWDLAAGTRIQQWHLPEGIADALAFAGSGELILLRAERREKGDERTDPAQGSRPAYVVRIRNLMADPPLQLMAELHEFNGRVMKTLASPDGRFFVVEGRGGPDGHTRALKVFDRRGQVRFSIPTTWTRKYSTITLDSAGETLVVLTKDEPDETGIDVYDLTSGKMLRSLDRPPLCVSPGAKLLAAADEATGDEQQIGLYRTDTSQQIFAIESDRTSAAAFSPDGRLLAWGTTDGRVLVCDIGREKGSGTNSAKHPSGHRAIGT